MYTLITTMNGSAVLKENPDGSISSIPCNLTNSDYVVYLAWLAEGTTPLSPQPGPEWKLNQTTWLWETPISE